MEHENEDTEEYITCCDRSCSGCCAPSCECVCWIPCPTCRHGEVEGECRECNGEEYVKNPKL